MKRSITSKTGSQQPPNTALVLVRVVGTLCMRTSTVPDYHLFPPFSNVVCATAERLSYGA